jgi:hypothetical protein
LLLAVTVDDIVIVSVLSVVVSVEDEVCVPLVMVKVAVTVDVLLVDDVGVSEKVVPVMEETVEDAVVVVSR